MTGLRLLADDLTGALDTAAELVGVTGPVHAFWHGAIPSELPANAAVDSGTRELDAAAAVAVVARLAPVLAGAELAYKKVDTLLRGPTLAEVAACARAGWEHAVFAPAFPFQGRATRGGVQYARNAEGRWSAVGGDIVAALGAFGVRAQSGRPDAPLPPGVSVFDAEADTDLARIAALGRGASGPVLWIGAGGLAQALAAGAPGEAIAPLPTPILGLFGSDQAVTAGQLAACGPDWMRLPDGGRASAERMVNATARPGPRARQPRPAAGPRPQRGGATYRRGARAPRGCTTAAWHAARCRRRDVARLVPKPRVHTALRCKAASCPACPDPSCAADAGTA